MIRLASAALVMLLVAGCMSSPPDATTTTPAVTPTAPAVSLDPADMDISEAGALVDANTRFAFDAFREVSAAMPGSNLVVSPYSISTALQMVYGGADGETRTAIADALRLGSAEPTLDEEAHALLNNLTSSDPNVTLRIGNSLWLDETFQPEVDPAFPKRIGSAYQAELFTRDFRAEATVDDINAWASERTEGKIPKIVDRISEDEIMFLINAVYFKGAWTEQFNKSCTHAADFVTSEGTAVQVDMMCGAGPRARHTFAQDAERTIARVPYGDGRFAMYLVLPAEGEDLDGFVASWDGDVSGVEDPNVELEMPRLKLATRSVDLRPPLTELGMGIAFTDQADLTRIGEGLYISRVTHDAVLEVDEEGTVAAAVTNVGVGTTSLPPPPLHLVLDRPFLAMIRDDASGTVLFLAKVHDPTQE